MVVETPEWSVIQPFVRGCVEGRNVGPAECTVGRLRAVWAGLA